MNLVAGAGGTWRQRRQPGAALDIKFGIGVDLPTLRGVARLLFHRAAAHRLSIVLAALAIVLMGGCRADVTVAVRATGEGGGDISATVSLDKAAAEQVPDLAEQLKVEDLRAAGWRIDGPVPAAGGRTELSAVKAFASPAEASRLFQELTGHSGPFGSLHLTRDRSLLKTRTTLTGRVDLAGGLEAFSDEVAKEKLGGQPLGIEPAKLEAELGKPLADVFGFRLTADLPGDIDSDGSGVWEVRLGQATAVNASAEQWNLTTVAAGATSAVSALALLVVLARRTRRRP